MSQEFDYEPDRAPERPSPSESAHPTWNASPQPDYTEAWQQYYAQAGYPQQDPYTQQGAHEQQYAYAQQDPYTQQGAYEQQHAYAQQYRAARPYPAGLLTDEERTMAMLAHLLSIFTGFIGPLVIFLIKGKESAFVRQHAAEALNFELTTLIAGIAMAILAFPMFLTVFLIPVWTLALFALAIGGLVLEIMACIKANNGVWYRYPINIRMVK